jgi:hypothetical protein
MAGEQQSNLQQSNLGYTTSNDLLKTYQRLGGIAWTYQFQVKGIYETGGGAVNGFESTSVLATKLPGKKLNNATVSYGAFDFNVPMNTVFPDNLNWSLTFLSDQKGTLRNFYEFWQDSFYNYNTQQFNVYNYNTQQFNGKLYDIELSYGTGTPTDATKNVLKGLVNEFNNGGKPLITPVEIANIEKGNIIDIDTIVSYTTDIRLPSDLRQSIRNALKDVDQTDPSSVSTYTLYGCFPVLLNGLDFDTSQKNLIKFTVTLAYQYFKKGSRSNKL